MKEDNSNTSFSKIQHDLSRTVGLNTKYFVWMTFLTVALVVCLYAYFVQLKNGLGVTGMRDFISWGMYISNFVFFIATSLVGLLISSILGLSGQKWITPISRIAEILAVAFAIVAGLVIVSDMGRPDRVLHLLFYGRLQSPIIWDITVVITYVVMSVLLLYLPLIPDTYALKNYKTFPKWQQKLYKFLSAGWSGRPEQIAIVKKSIRILLILIIPVGLAIHTVTSWLFATTSRVGWDSTIFGPYFVAGAFVAGVGAVIVAMYFFRINYKLKEYLTDLHFDKMGKLLVLVMFVYIYFNINEFLVPGFKLKSDDAVHLKELFTGHWSTLFWFAIIPCMIIPTILMFFTKMRKPFPMLIISLFVIIGAWIKRYLIVVPTMSHPFLPVQNVSEEYVVYSPTAVEILVTAASFIIVLLIVSVLAKVFPIIPMWEYEHEQKENE